MLLAPPLPLPQAAAVPVTTPELSTCRHWVEPVVIPEIVRLVVEAVPMTCSALLGVATPTPTFPETLSTNSKGELVPTRNSGLRYGVVEPTESTPANVLVAVVLVAKRAATVGVEVETMEVPLNASTMSAPIELALVPPLAIGKTPVTPEVRFTESTVRALAATVSPAPANSLMRSEPMLNSPLI